MTSRAYAIFETGMQDVAKLIQLFDNLESPEQRQQYEVLKRAALVMTTTAWESYIEAFLHELLLKKINGIQGSFAGDFIQQKFEAEIKKLNNPSGDKVRQLSKEFLRFDITEYWKWANTEPAQARQQLNHWLSKRGDAVHRSCESDNPQKAHLVKKEDLDKAVRFFRELVKITDGSVA